MSERVDSSEPDFKAIATNPAPCSAGRVWNDEAADKLAARIAEARYRAMGTAGLVDFDTFVHLSDMP